MNDKLKSKINGGLNIFIFVVLIIASGFFLPGWLGTLFKSPGGGLALTWLVIAIFMILIINTIGLSLGKGSLGILIDSRNMMSLSRLQIVLWTVVVLSAFLTLALARVNDSRIHPDGYNCPVVEVAEGETPPVPECADPIGIQLPPLLWALMGISVTSAVASPLIKASKAQRTEDEDQRRTLIADNSKDDRGVIKMPAATFKNRLAEATTGSDAAPLNEGALVKKESWTLARFSDIFSGEEVTNFGYVDIAKVQNFFFTIVTLVAYLVALAIVMTSTNDVAKLIAFPDLPAGLIGVISISYGGYLTDKAFTHSTPALPRSDT